jgi:hypothetical protein
MDYNIGEFPTQEAAARAYDVWLRKWFAGDVSTRNDTDSVTITSENTAAAAVASCYSVSCSVVLLA